MRLTSPWLHKIVSKLTPQNVRSHKVYSKPRPLNVRVKGSVCVCVCMYSIGSERINLLVQPWIPKLCKVQVRPTEREGLVLAFPDLIKAHSGLPLPPPLPTACRTNLYRPFYPPPPTLMHSFLVNFLVWKFAVNCNKFRAKLRGGGRRGRVLV